VSDTPNLPLPQLANGQQNFLLVNQSLAIIDALLQTPVISKDLTAAPGSPANGALYIIGSAWAGITDAEAGNLALYRTDSGWIVITPKEGWKKEVAADEITYRYDGEDWIEWSTGAGGGMSNPMTTAQDLIFGGESGAPERLAVGSNGQVLSVVAGELVWATPAASSGSVPVVTESGTSLTATGSNAGNYTRFTNASAKTYSFDSAETYAVGAEYHGRNAGAGDLTLTEVGSFAINPPAGGTLVVEAGGSFTLKIVGAAEADLIGSVVAA